MSQASVGSAQIPYRVVAEWAIPNGGFSRVVVVATQHRNESDLQQLAEQLKLDTVHDRNAFVFIYDDEVAARERQAALRDYQGEGDFTHHDSHLIGFYFRNINTGYHAITTTLDEVEGPGKETRL